MVELKRLHEKECLATGLQLSPSDLKKRRLRSCSYRRAKAEKIKFHRIGNLRTDQRAGNSRQDVERFGVRLLQAIRYSTGIGD